MDNLRVIDGACTVLGALRRIHLLVVEEREEPLSFWYSIYHAPPEVASSAPTAFSRVSVDHSEVEYGSSPDLVGGCCRKQFSKPQGQSCGLNTSSSHGA